MSLRFWTNTEPVSIIHGSAICDISSDSLSLTFSLLATKSITTVDMKSLMKMKLVICFAFRTNVKGRMKWKCNKRNKEQVQYDKLECRWWSCSFFVVVMLNNFNCGLDNRLYTQQARSDATDTGINYRQPKYAQSGTYHTEYSHTTQ